MRTTLYFFSGLNYNDRIIETRLYTHGDFVSAGYTLVATIPNIDFDPNDGINTSILIDYDHNNAGLKKFFTGENEPSYLVAETDKTDTYPTDISKITTCWWVMDGRRTRVGQYNIELLRDVIHDYHSTISGSTFFVEKGTVAKDNTLIFNKEDMDLSEIKKNEYLLKDNSNVPWLVGYIDKTSEITGTIPVSNPNTTLISTPIEEWEYYEYNSSSNVICGPVLEATFYMDVKMPGSSTGVRRCMLTIFRDVSNRNKNITTGSSSSTTSLTISNNQALLNKYGDEYNILEAAFEAGTLAFEGTTADAQSYLPEGFALSSVQVQDLIKLNNKLIQDSTGKIYKVRVKFTENYITSNEIKITAGRLFNELSYIPEYSYPDIEIGQKGILGTPNAGTFSQKTKHQGYWIELERIEGEETSFSLPTTRLHTADAPYDIFCIPYGDVSIIQSSGTTTITKDMALSLARRIQVDGGDKVYDVQLLPYCPVPEFVYDKNIFSIISAKTSTYSRVVKQSTDTLMSIVFFVSSSMFSFNIPFVMSYDSTDPITVKVENQCKKYRLCSPNYSNYFDFSLVKNGGINYFNVDCAYKPYSPYIHVNPNFNKMYGRDFNDPRGLVLGGDFSITQITDAWQNYQIQNKYFQEVFDRQIENLDVNNSITRQIEKWNMGGGVIQGAGAGALAGSYGGIYGAAAGAIIGGGASLWGGQKDIKYNEQLREEQRSYMIDNFGYQLKTIQALPQTLSKVSALNPNNKIFPVFEVYDCAAEERKAFVRKLFYDGMTVMTIGYLYEYFEEKPYGYSNLNDAGTLSTNIGSSRNFVRGRLIELSGSSITPSVSNHTVQQIKNEMLKGVYWKK